MRSLLARGRRLAALLLVVVCSMTTPVLAACPVVPLPEWTREEAWVWVRLCEGRPADLAELHQTSPTPWAPDEWTESFRLSAEFLRVLATDRKLWEQLPRGRIEIRHAWFSEPIDLSTARIGVELWLNFSRFDHGIDFWGATLERTLSLDGSYLGGPLTLIRAELKTNLLLADQATFDRIWLQSARIGGDVSLDTAAAYGPIEWSEAKIGGSVSMRDGYFASLNGVGARLGGALDLEGSMVVGQVALVDIQVERGVSLRRAEIQRDADLAFAKIGGDVDLSGLRVGRLDLSNASIGRSLRIERSGAAAASERQRGWLVLRHASATSLRLDDTASLAVHPIELNGFTFRHLAGTEAVIDAADRPVHWFIDWLAQDLDYSSQPYIRMADVLRAAGHPSKADRIRLEGRWREWKGEPWAVSKLLLLPVEAITGYGDAFERFARVLMAVFLLAALGALVLRLTGDAVRHDPPLGMAYALGTLVPAFRLVEADQRVALSAWGRRYLLVHRVAGFLLATILATSLAGFGR